MTDRRQEDRRDDMEISVGEVYRLCLDIKAGLERAQVDAKQDRHNLNDRIDAHGIELAVQAEQIKTVATQISGSRVWLAGIASGAIVGVVIVVAQHFIK